MLKWPKKQTVGCGSCEASRSIFRGVYGRTKNLSNKQGIRHASADGSGVLLGIFLHQQDVRHCHGVIEVSIGNQCDARGELEVR